MAAKGDARKKNHEAINKMFYTDDWIENWANHYDH